MELPGGVGFYRSAGSSGAPAISRPPAIIRCNWGRRRNMTGGGLHWS